MKTIGSYDIVLKLPQSHIKSIEKSTFGYLEMFSQIYATVNTFNELTIIGSMAFMYFGYYNTNA